MKNYKYKLEPLLKLRKFRENRAKIELGRINKKIYELQEEIRSFETDIKEIYNNLEALGENQTEAGFMSSFANLIRARELSIINNHKKIDEHKIEFKEKQEEVLKLRGEVKIIENMKEKDFQNYRKEFMKKVNLDLEEQNLMNSFYEKDSERS